MYYTAYTESLNTLNPKLILALAHVVGYLARALATLKRLKAGELTRERLASCAARRPIEQLAIAARGGARSRRVDRLALARQKLSCRPFDRVVSTTARLPVGSPPVSPCLTHALPRPTLRIELLPCCMGMS